MSACRTRLADTSEYLIPQFCFAVLPTIWQRLNVQILIYYELTLDQTSDSDAIDAAAL
jgi:hypothetical protein